MDADVCARVCAHECSARSGQKKALAPLELEFQAVMTCLTPLQELAVLESSRRTVCASGR